MLAPVYAITIITFQIASLHFTSLRFSSSSDIPLAFAVLFPSAVSFPSPSACFDWPSCASPTMKIFLVGWALLGLVAATPVQNVESRGFENMGNLSNTISKRLSLSDTRNQLGECRPVTVIFARGTIETGNVGAIVGPPFFSALGLAIGDENVGVQGVDYLATILGYLEGKDTNGAATLASLLEQAVSLCPLTQIVLSGYRSATPFQDI